MTGINHNLDLVNMNDYIKFGQTLSICSQDIERKQNSDINQGPKLCYKLAKRGVQQSQPRSSQYQCMYKIW